MFNQYKLHVSATSKWLFWGIISQK